MPNPSAAGAAGSASDDASIDAADAANGNDDGAGGSSDTVPYSRMAKVIAQRQEERRKNAELAAELKKRDDADLAKRAAELAEQGKHEQIAKEANERATRAEADAKAAKLENERMMKKYAVSVAALTDPRALEPDDIFHFVNLDAITITDGVVAGAVEAVDELRKAKPYLFGNGEVSAGTKQAPRVAQSVPRTTGGKPITKEELRKSPSLMTKLLNENPQEYDRIMRS